MSIFVQSVSAAVQESMTGSKIMLVYLENQNHQDISSWCSSLIQNSINNIKNNEILIPVKVLNPSQDYSFFTQVFQNVATPSIYLIKKGAVLDIIDSKISEKEFEERVFAVTKDIERNSVENSNINETSDSTSNHSIKRHSSSSDGVENSDSNSSSQIEKSKDLKAHGLRPTGKSSSSDQKVYHSMKEHFAEVKAKNYKEEQKRLTREQKDDKDHISALLKQDRIEIPHTNSSVKNQNKSKKLKSKKAVMNHDQDKCTLLIRLFDGSKITNEFKSSDTLLKVRNWIDSRTKDDVDQPYTFCEAVTRISYSVHEESLTLKNLHLVPRSVLILKPEENYSNAYPVQHSWVGKIADTLYNYLGYQNISTHNEHTDSIPNNDTENDVNSLNEDANSFYSSASNFNTSFVSLSDLNKDKDSTLTYNGNHTKLERDPKAKKD